MVNIRRVGGGGKGCLREGLLADVATQSAGEQVDQRATLVFGLGTVIIMIVIIIMTTLIMMTIKVTP